MIVKELGSEDMKKCNIQIPDDSLYVDSSYSREKSAAQLIALWEESFLLGKNPMNLLCGVIGPIDPQANEGVAVLTETRRIPQIAYATIDHRLSRAGDFPTFRRVIPRAEEFSASIAYYLERDIWERSYLAIIYDQSDYGEQFEDPLEEFEDLYCYATMTESIVEGDDDSIYASLGEAKEEGYRTVVLITNRPSVLNDVARVASELGMLNGDYFWIISGDAFPPAQVPHMKYPVDSPTDKLLRGSALFTNYDRFVYQGETDPFLQEWRRQHSSFVEQLNSKQPLKLGGNPHYTAPATYFADETPTEYASFIYDAVITAGLSACQAEISLENKSALRFFRNVNVHLDYISRTAFNGASGPVSFLDDNNRPQTSRNVEGVMYGIYNVRPGAVDEENMRQ